MKKVGILMGSDSDLPVIQKGTAILKELEIPFEVHVYSAHRTPEQARAFCAGARENGFGVLICAAGMAAHLAGAAAAVSTTSQDNAATVKRIFICSTPRTADCGRTR